jgi:hypothetical protein
VEALSITAVEAPTRLRPSTAKRPVVRRSHERVEVFVLVMFILYYILYVLTMFREWLMEEEY